MIQICVYLFILALFLMLGILSRNEKALLSESDSCVSRWLRRISVYLYRKHLRLRRKRGRRGAPSESSSAEMVRQNLRILHPSVRIRTEEAKYFVDKIQIILVFLLAADILASALWFSDRQEPLISGEGVIQRPEDSGSSYQLTAEVSTEDTSGKSVSIGE